MAEGKLPEMMGDMLLTDAGRFARQERDRKVADLARQLCLAYDSWVVVVEESVATASARGGFESEEQDRIWESMKAQVQQIRALLGLPPGRWL